MFFIRRGGSNIKNTSALPAVATMTGEKLDAELKKGYDSIKAGRVYSADEVDELLEKEFDLKFTPTKRRPHAPNNCFD
ncbi:hypothetical protein [Lachnoanaerobaculum gingivalis]